MALLHLEPNNHSCGSFPVLFRMFSSILDLTSTQYMSVAPSNPDPHNDNQNYFQTLSNVPSRVILSQLTTTATEDDKASSSELIWQAFTKGHRILG